MIERTRIWWAEKAPYERVVLGTLGALSFVVAYWLLVLAPSWDAAERSQSRLSRAVDDAAVQRGQAQHLISAGAASSNSRSNQSLQSAIRSAFEQNNVTAASMFELANTAVQVTVEDGNASLLLSAMDVIEGDFGLTILAFDIQRGSAGRVMASITVSGQ